MNNLLEDYKVHCMEAQTPSDEAYAKALLAQSIAEFAKAVNESRVMLKDRLDRLITAIEER